MANRIEYDRMARESGQASAQVLSDADLMQVDAKMVAWEVFQVDLEEGAVDVDDVEEARARWVAAFVKGYEDEREVRAEARGEEVA